MFAYVKEQLFEIQNKIRTAAEKAGRKPDDIKLIAVSKTFPPEAVLTAYEAGQRLFGENRVQELESKLPALPTDIQWHLIGHLQGNKAAKAIESASWIHSVDSVKLLNRLDRLAGEMNKKTNILLELNISGEKSKFGVVSETETMDMAEEACKCKNLVFSGLMTMAPYGSEKDELHRIFSNLRLLRDRMETEFSVKLPELSMGMSSDYEPAICEGATFLRIGTSIFGKRDYGNA